VSWISVENVTLDFPALAHRKRGPTFQELKGQTTGGAFRINHQGEVYVRALDDISLVLEPGDRLALLGHNGAGKTTLLRTMAGIYPPTHGRVHIDGRVIPLLNLNFGLDLEATGLDNILVRGLYLGMSRAEIKSKLIDIASFSDLGEFLNFPMRTYSAGMRARLAFAIATNIEADILLLDEGLVTGDASFLQKASKKFEHFASQSNILVLASHSNKTLRELCNKGLLLEQGRVKAFGPLEEVINIYKDSLSRIVTPPRKEIQDSQALPSDPISSNSQFTHQGNAKERGTANLEAPFSKSYIGKPKILRILLINDTGALSNPGCRAVQKGYKVLFRDHIVRSSIGASVPVNYWIDHFRDIAISGKHSMNYRTGMFPVGTEVVEEIDIFQWERKRHRLVLQDMDFNEKLAMCDVVLVNGEGSIHHNSVRALALLALIKTAVEAKKKVLLLNATLQAVMPALLKEVLKEVNLIQVREPCSYDFLKNLGIKSLIVPDIAFLGVSDETESQIRIQDSNFSVLVTGGVTTGKESLEQLFIAVESMGMRPVYFSIGDGGEMEVAKNICAQRNVKLIEAGTFGVKELVGFIRQFPLAISGRHHINVFLMRAGIPFVALPSNTWKVEGTLSMVGYPIPPVYSYDELKTTLCQVRNDSKSLGNHSYRAYETGKVALNKLVSELTACNL
jgi:ABC-type polysaccharide/polyol phosphate transport system ATPase subunit